MSKDLFDKHIPWYTEFYYKCYRGWNKIADIPFEIKMFWQRGKRGYCDRDIWNFHAYITKIISECLGELAKDKHGCPTDFFKCPIEYIDCNSKCDECKSKNNNKCIACKEWEDLLLDLSRGFKEYHEGVIEGGIIDELYKNRDINIKSEPDENPHLRRMDITVTPEITDKEREENNKKMAEADRKFKEEIGPKFIKNLSGMWD